MKDYTAYNLIISAIVLPAAYWLPGKPSRGRILKAIFRIASLITLIAYPWDFFAIHVGLWSYPADPGLKIYDVPVNDLFFIWLSTCLACTVLIAIGRWNAGQRHS